MKNYFMLQLYKKKHFGSISLITYMSTYDIKNVTYKKNYDNFMDYVLQAVETNTETF